MADRPLLALATYHALPGKEKEFVSLIRAHWPVLSRRGLVTARRPVLGRSASTPGVFVEVFEWKSPVAVERAHRDPEVQRIWNAMALISAKPAATLARLPECEGPFPNFQILDPNAAFTDGKDGAAAPAGKKPARRPAARPAARARK
ncbi:MAG: hypothetical protein L0216_05785 [Planctomycetales bacterium]|nr:hypothetical protein [Planctomycetales bacterium]